MSIFYRKNKLFKIDTDKLSHKAKTPEIINGLYLAVFEEFRGASDNPKYKRLNYSQKMSELNKFAENWLKIRNLL